MIADKFAEDANSEMATVESGIPGDWMVSTSCVIIPSFVVWENLRFPPRALIVDQRAWKSLLKSCGAPRQWSGMDQLAFLNLRNFRTEQSH